MASTSSCVMLLWLSLFLLGSGLSFARHTIGNQLQRSTKSPKLQAEMLIKGLNLFPKHAINIATSIDEGSLGDAGPKIVEKELKLNVLGSPGASVKDFAQHAGFYRLPHTEAARMFYLFFESRESKNDPVVIWLTGGPGCSSELALFYENGPFKINSNLSLSWNDYGWDKASNIIFVDQPTGTGFSVSTSESDIRHDEEGVSNDLYDFLQEFFKGHPEFAGHDFYITGESYAGHYIPALASRVSQGNKNNEGIHINLKGFAIGNGLTDPGIQYKAYTDYALDRKLISESDYNTINQLIPDCEQQIEACGTNDESACENAYDSCNQIFSEILDIAGDINYYDIRKKCVGTMCYDFSNLEKFLNEETVRDALGVGDTEFVSCSTEVYDAMEGDWMRNYEVGIPALLEDGIGVLIYAGEEDLICNWLGNSRWVHAMEWSGQKEFNATSTVPFLVDGAEAGELKSYGPLAFLKVYEAGHLVPMDQPKAALQMLQNWTQGSLQ